MIMKIIKKIIKYIIIYIYKLLYIITPLSTNIIVFESSVGRNYTGNPKAIYEELVKQKLDKEYKCIWILENLDENVPGNCKKIKRQRILYFYYMTRAKFWITDSRQPVYLKKKKGNIYIQTWHGTPLKKLGIDMSFVNMGTDRDINEYKKNFKKDTIKWDYLISQNSYSTNIFRHAFAFNKNFLEIGYPRNDVLFNYAKQSIEDLKEELGIPETNKVILYAPTWRDNKFDEKGNYKFELKINLEEFCKEFSKGYTLILKPHYLVRDKIDVSKYGDLVKVCSINYDIQNLYLISDMLITDYSSVMFDYAILKRPIILYMYDLQEYQEQMREFYFDILKEAPGEIVQTSSQLINEIKRTFENFDSNSKKYSDFYKKYSSKDNGFASDRVIKIIKEHMEFKI